jgi:hypothetical protein
MIIASCHAHGRIARTVKAQAIRSKCRGTLVLEK